MQKHNNILSFWSLTEFNAFNPHLYSNTNEQLKIEIMLKMSNNVPLFREIFKKLFIKYTYCSNQKDICLYFVIG